MNHEVQEVSVKGVMPTPTGCAIFLGDGEKTFVIYVDPGIGQAISMTINSVKKERPLTHDLMGSIFLGFGIEVQRVEINDVKESTFFARLQMTMENELGKKVVEVDARPSDCIVLALQHTVPILVSRSVLDEVEDMTGVLKRILKQQQEESEDE